MSFMSNILSKTGVSALAVGVAVALAPVQVDASTIRIEDLSGGGAADFTLADTGVLAEADIDTNFTGMRVRVTVEPEEQPGKSFLSTVSITTDGVGHIRITTSEDGFGQGARDPLASQLAFSVTSSRLSDNGLEASAYVDNLDALEGLGDQIGSGLTLAGPVTAGTAAGSTTDSSVLADPFSMTSIFEIKHDNNNDRTQFDATVLAAVPLPAGGLLLLTALGGMAAVRRRRKAA